MDEKTALTQKSDLSDSAVCSKCQLTLSHNEFYLKPDGSLRYSKCKKCWREEQKKRDEEKNITATDAPEVPPLDPLQPEEFQRLVKAFQVLAKVRDRIQNER